MNPESDLLQDFLCRHLPALLERGQVNRVQVREVLGVIGLIATSVRPNAVLASSFREPAALLMAQLQKAGPKAKLLTFLQKLASQNPGVALFTEMIGQAGFAASKMKLDLSPAMAPVVLKQAENLWGENEPES